MDKAAVAPKSVCLKKGNSLSKKEGKKMKETPFLFEFTETTFRNRLSRQTVFVASTRSASIKKSI